MKKGMWPVICTKECGHPTWCMADCGLQGREARGILYRIRGAGLNPPVGSLEKYFSGGAIRPRPELGPKANRPYDAL